MMMVCKNKYGAHKSNTEDMNVKNETSANNL
jgi:hypothetical protein